MRQRWSDIARWRQGALAIVFAFVLACTPLAWGAGDVSNTVDFTGDVIYQILTDRFVNGDPGNDPGGTLFSAHCSNLRKYCGGDWAGIVQRIEDGYLPGMGIGALWITQPVENVFSVLPDFAGSTSYHGFWARDYKRANPFFGSLDDFRRLLAVAHAHGIKVIIDFTPNHSSPSREGQSGFMEDGIVLDDGAMLASLNSDPSGLFHHNGGSDFSSFENGIYRSLFDLADYEHMNPALDAYLKDAIGFWLDLGIDGIRVDAVKHVAPGWLKTWTDAVYSHRPVFVFGEWLNGGEIDTNNIRFANDSGMSVLDFRFNSAIRRILRDRTAGWEAFEQMLVSSAADYDRVIDLPIFIDSHDMQRFQRIGATTRWTDQALAITLTSRGPPIVYYGTEQYMTGFDDPDNRRMMTAFDRQTVAYQVIQRLSGLRRNNPALAWGDTVVRLRAGDVFVYERRFGDAVVLVATSRASSGSVLVSGVSTALPAGEYRDVLAALLDGGVARVGTDGVLAPFALAPGAVAVWAFERAPRPGKFGPVLTRSETAGRESITPSGPPRIGHVGPVSLRAGQVVTLDGRDFGSRPGGVRFGMSTGSVLAWHDRRIRVQVPALTAGLYDISVQRADGATSAAWPRFEILTGKQVLMRFVVDNADTFFGQNVWLTGNVHEMGNWSEDPTRAIGPFFNQIEFQFPTWYYDVSVPAGQVLQFRFIKIAPDGSVVREQGPAHVFSVPASGTAQVRVTWQN